MMLSRRRRRTSVRSLAAQAGLDGRGPRMLRPRQRLSARVLLAEHFEPAMDAEGASR